MGALSLYLNLVNLFQLLLTFFGQHQEVYRPGVSARVSPPTSMSRLSTAYRHLARF